MSNALAQKKCKPCKGGVPAMTGPQARVMLKDVPGWELKDGEIERTFQFGNYDETLSFVNSAASIAKLEDHHPQIDFGYKTCKVRYTTHAVKGLSENDFICAAKINELVR